MFLAIVIISTWMWIANTVLCSISIEVDPTLIEYGKSGVNIKCVATGTNLIGITSIQLKRSESNVVSVSKYTVAWQDKELENKTEVTVNASISDVNASFLHLEIPGSVVRYRKDTGSYQCTLSGVTASGRASIYTSQSIVLTITGSLDLTTELFSSTNYKNTEVLVLKDGFKNSTIKLFISTNPKGFEASAEKGVVYLVNKQPISMAFVFISVWTLIASSAVGSILIEVEPSLIEYRKSGVNISCFVNGTNLIGITSIQLKRSESNVVSISKYTVAWQDKELENKTEVTVNASISDVNASFLHLEIPGSVVRYRKDTGSYQCTLSGVTASGRASIYTSQSIVLNITGFPDLTTDIFSTNHANFEVSVQKGYLEFSTESHMNNTSLQNENESFLILYRKIMIPVATLISCVFAFIIVRELRLYYVVSNATNERTEEKYTNEVYIV